MAEDDFRNLSSRSDQLEDLLADWMSHLDRLRDVIDDRTLTLAQRTDFFRIVL